MALAKNVVIDRVEVIEDGTIQVREATYVLEDGARIAGPIYARSTLEPTEAIDPRLPPRVRAVAAAVWTPDVIAAFRAKRATQSPTVKVATAPTSVSPAARARKR